MRTTCPELLHGSGADANRTHDLSITSPTTYHYIKIEITAVKSFSFKIPRCNRNNDEPAIFMGHPVLYRVVAGSFLMVLEHYSIDII